MTFILARGYYGNDMNLKTDYDVEKIVSLVRLVDTTEPSSNISWEGFFSHI